jgi:type IV pilus assembly protein PilW
MVALVLGLIIVGGASAVYLTSKRSLTETEQIAALSENGRFALQLISDSVRHIGFYGGANPADIRPDDSLGAVVGDCTGGAQAYDTENSIFAVRAVNATVLGCITDAVVGTDVLVIKGVEPTPLSDADPDDPDAERDGDISFPEDAWSDQETYVIANSESGILLDGADTRPGVGEGEEFALGAAWPYRLQIYYIRDGATPTLSRKVLTWDGAAGGMFVDTQDLIPGVENIRYLFGYDASSDGRVDSIANLTDVTTADAWNQVISLQAFILLRSDLPDPNYSNAKTYQLGDTQVTQADNLRRLLLHSDIVMRNPRLVLNGGTF